MVNMGNVFFSNKRSWTKWLSRFSLRCTTPRQFSRTSSTAHSPPSTTWYIISFINNTLRIAVFWSHFAFISAHGALRTCKPLGEQGKAGQEYSRRNPFAQAYGHSNCFSFSRRLWISHTYAWSFEECWEFSGQNLWGVRWKGELRWGVWWAMISRLEMRWHSVFDSATLSLECILTTGIGLLMK